MTGTPTMNAGGRQVLTVTGIYSDGSLRAIRARTAVITVSVRGIDRRFTITVAKR